MFELLFKYPVDAFREGQFTFASRVPIELRLLIAAALAGGALHLYRRSPRRVKSWARYVLTGVRALVLVLVLAMVLQPVLRFENPSSGALFTAVLVDDSRSMSIRDASGGKTRLEAAHSILQHTAEGKDAGLIAELSRLCPVRLFAFDSELRRAGVLEEMTGEGDYTSLYRALRRLDDEMRGVPVAGIVLLTDGAHNTAGDPREMARLMRLRGVPIFTVGLGCTSPPDDYEVVSIQAPRRVRRNATVEVFVTVRCSGYREAFQVRLIKDDTILHVREVDPLAGSELQRIKLGFFPEQKGATKYAVDIPPGPAEKITENNRREFLVEVFDDRLPVLYIEGSPRQEYRFIRRALSRDNEFRIVSILRTGHGRYIVQGGEDDPALKDGYPKTRESLFKYEAIIFGDIEAGHFTREQLNLTEEFVNKRGGGFLMLGGVNSFNLGKYQGTPIEKMLPVALESRAVPYNRNEFPIQVTEVGAKHPIMHQVDDRVANRHIWNKTPPLMGANVVRKAKPAASVLAFDARSRNIVLAVQPYGAGRSAAFTTGGSWYWRMTRRIEDELQEKFWKQLIRWLAVGSRPKLTVEMDKDIYGKGEPVFIRSTVLGQVLEPVNDALVIARVTDPFGNVDEISLEWILSREGVYQGRYVPNAKGEHAVEVTATFGEKESLKRTATFSVGTPFAEFNNLGQKAGLLRELASITGGAYFDEQTVAEGLPKAFREALRMKRDAEVTVEDCDLWDMPLLLVLLIVALGFEWWLRRRQGLS